MILNDFLSIFNFHHFDFQFSPPSLFNFHPSQFSIFASSISTSPPSICQDPPSQFSIFTSSMFNVHLRFSIFTFDFQVSSPHFSISRLLNFHLLTFNFQDSPYQFSNFSLLSLPPSIHHSPHFRRFPLSNFQFSPLHVFLPLVASAGIAKRNQFSIVPVDTERVRRRVGRLSWVGSWKPGIGDQNRKLEQQIKSAEASGL